MSKTLLTKKIEYAVFDHFHVKRSIRCALEVSSPTLLGRVDLVGIKEDTIYCIEIKTTFSDFKSKNGHNFDGNLNYYAIPIELLDKIKELVPDEIGIITVKENNYDYEGYPKFTHYDVEVFKRCKTLKIKKEHIKKFKDNFQVALSSNVRNMLKERIKSDSKVY